MPTIIDGTAGITFPNSTIQASAGTVLQVVQGTTSTLQTLATATYTDLTGLSITITPKFSTSKFLLTYSVHSNLNASGRGFAIQFVRNGTAVYAPSIALEVYSANASDLRVGSSNQYLDAPATGSAITYKLQASSYSGSSIDFNPYNIPSTLTIMEIAG